jgi:two-component system sensor histidine kinase VanS
MSARLRLTLSYTLFLVAAGAVVAFGVYVVLRYVPDYPLTAANPRDSPAVASRQDILSAVVKYSAAILVGLAAVGLGGGWLLAGWILRPLDDITEAARRAAAGRLDHRIRLTGRSDEFKALADSFDDMLAQIDSAFSVQERFIANASHELRTPLAVTATMLDVARADPDQDNELLERLQLTNARTVGLLEALLRLADANAVTAGFETVDLAQLTRAALADAEPGPVAIEAELEPALVTGDPALLAQVAANLVQNALRHGHTNARVTTTADGVLRVVNDGPEFTAEGAARLVEPFLRGQGRTRADGYGLGLALVARIATLHGATLTVVPRPGGGLDVTVAFGARATTTGGQSR